MCCSVPGVFARAKKKRCARTELFAAIKLSYGETDRDDCVCAHGKDICTFSRDILLGIWDRSYVMFVLGSLS